MNKLNNESYQKIMNAAEEIIIEKGVKDTSLADIAGKAGISKGTLYYYYSSKSDLIFDIAERHLEKITEQIMNLVNESYRNKKTADPRKILEMTFKELTKDSTYMKLHIYLLKEAVIGSSELKIRFVEDYKKWRGMIEDSLTKLFGGKVEDAASVSQAILAAADGFKIQMLLGFDDLDFDKASWIFAKSIK
ncbi:MAG: TetR/AcrR family transcriptional regulator [Bacillota bacterium]